MNNDIIHEQQQWKLCKSGILSVSKIFCTSNIFGGTSIAVPNVCVCASVHNTRFDQFDIENRAQKIEFAFD